MPSDAERYQHLKKWFTVLAAASRDGPAYPRLRFEWDVCGRHPEISPKEGLDAAVDASIKKLSGL